MPAELRAKLDDADVVLLVWDALKRAARGEAAAVHFMNLGIYWRARGRFAKAVARGRRAIELHREHAEAHRELGRTLAYRAAEDPDLSPEEKRALLQEAEAAVRTFVVLDRETPGSFEDLGFIRDEAGDLDGAAESYRRGRDLALAEAQAKGERPDASVTYNLAQSRRPARRGAERTRSRAGARGLGTL